MDKDAKQALQVAKEITVKFIETGRISPTNFPENFSLIYTEVLRAIREESVAAAPGSEPGENQES